MRSSLAIHIMAESGAQDQLLGEPNAEPAARHLQHAPGLWREADRPPLQTHAQRVLFNSTPTSPSQGKYSWRCQVAGSQVLSLQNNASIHEGSSTCCLVQLGEPHS